MKYRTERDSLGDVKVPAERYWGAQTQRCLENFDIGHETMPAALVRAYGVVKFAAAEVNADLKLIDPKIAGAIQRAAREVIDGKLDDEFPLKIWQSGSGTQTNMNVNEVIANRANEILGAERGAKKPVHPNDHVNCSQSTNDTFPTAMHIAVVREVANRLLPALDVLYDTLEKLSRKYAGVIKTGRTHLMDATPLSLGQVIGGWAGQLADGRSAATRALEPVYSLALGGTAVGTGLNTHPEYAARAAASIAALTGEPFVTAPNKFAALAAHDAMMGFSGCLKQLAGALMKIANDVRWLASGPRCGIGEISIPSNEPGSSIMPGKVNPTQCETLTMVCCQVIGYDAAVSLGACQGNFELNVYKPLIAHGVLTSIGLLADAMTSFNANCAVGITPNDARIRELMERSLMLATALSPYIGYDRTAEIVQKAHAENKTLRDAAVELGYVTEDEFDAYVKPGKMIEPGLD